mmetsp:Transcript_23860/g.62905  ORF Transcript_23860/g.62905 Transcript_23860/m.62905 type:complete len:243 (-) Transcript_23860:355-1083(-)
MVVVAQRDAVLGRHGDGARVAPARRGHRLPEHGDLGVGPHRHGEGLRDAADGERGADELHRGALVLPLVPESPEDEHVAVEDVGAHLPRVAAQLRVRQPRLLHLGERTRRNPLRLLGQPGREGRQELFRRGRQQRLPVLREQWHVRRSSVQDDHRGGLDVGVPAQLLAYRGHEERPGRAADEDEGGALQGAALAELLDGRLDRLVGVLGQLLQGGAGRLALAGAVRRPLVHGHLHVRGGAGR